MNGADSCYDLLWICLRNFSAIFKMDYHIWKLTLDSEKLNWTLKILNKCSFPNLIMLPGTWKCTMDPESSPNIVINNPNFSSVIPHFIAITKKEWPFLSKKQSSWKRTLQRHTKIKQWGTKNGYLVKWDQNQSFEVRWGRNGRRKCQERDWVIGFYSGWSSLEEIFWWSEAVCPGKDLGM